MELWAWAPGVGALVLPNGTGFPLGGTFPCAYIQIGTHYTNEVGGG